ncbi:unnamed protein product [Sphagnum balticum]
MDHLNSSAKNSIELLPVHIIHNILFEGGFGSIDLASLEATCYMFWADAGFEPCIFKSIAELAARHSCHMQLLFLHMPHHARLQLLARCDGNWKLVLRFLQALQQASQGGVATSTSHKTVQMVAGKYHGLIVDRNGKLYACGSGLHGILGQGPDIKCCQLPTRIALPNLPGLQIKQISGSHNHAAFITQARETWPTEEELMEASNDEKTRLSKKKKKLLVPCGTSDYQAAWIMDDEYEEKGEAAEDEDEEEAMEGGVSLDEEAMEAESEDDDNDTDKEGSVILE